MNFFALVLGAGILLTSMVLSIPIFALWTYHRRQMEQIRASQRREIAEETRRAIDEVRQEVRALRDTSTEFDVSFDTALQRLENRVERLERRQPAAEPESAPLYLEPR